jgi:hypothetical protein
MQFGPQRAQDQDRRGKSDARSHRPDQVPAPDRQAEAGAAEQ